MMSDRTNKWKAQVENWVVALWQDCVQELVKDHAFTNGGVRPIGQINDYEYRVPRRVDGRHNDRGVGAAMPC